MSEKKLNIIISLFVTILLVIGAKAFLQDNKPNVTTSTKTDGAYTIVYDTKESEIFRFKTSDFDFISYDGKTRKAKDITTIYDAEGNEAFGLREKIK